ncbi:MAG: hypothetical protein QM770_02250 [Tepidisphaeraceae bacterium]
MGRSSTYTQAQNPQLYVTDGTTTGTKFLLTGSGGEFIRVGAKVIFNLSTSPNNIWISDGTLAGTKQIATGISIATASSSASAGGFTYFRGSSTAAGRELYRTDGNTVTLVKDVVAGGGDSNPELITAVGNKVVYVATVAATGRELYVSDGTSAGTGLLKDINPGSAESSVDQLATVGNKVVFRAYDGDPVNSYTRELWSTDGTLAGTKKIAKVTIDSYQEALASNGRLLFRGTDHNQSPATERIFITDGDAVTPIYAISSGIDAHYFISLNGVVYFDETDATSGMELWRSNGTTIGTIKVVDINPGVGNSSPTDFTSTSNGLFFIADDGSHGRELWFAGGAKADAVAIGQGSNRPYRVVQLTFNDNLGSSITKDDVILRRRKDKRVMSGSYWKFSTFLDGSGRTVVQARVTKDDLQGKYEIVVLKNAVANSAGLANDHDIRVSFFLEPVTGGASVASVPVSGTVLSGDTERESLFADGDAILA